MCSKICFYFFQELAKKVEADDLSDYIRGALFLHAAKAKVNLDDVPMPLWLRNAGLVNLSMKLT